MKYSPNKKYTAELVYLSEIRFGPPYYKLILNGKEIKNRIFGELILWSDDSKYLATEEWLTIDYQEGPITKLVLFDIDNDSYSNFKIIHKGFAEDFNFESEKIIYKKHYYGRDEIIEVEVNIKEISNWKRIKY